MQAMSLQVPAAAVFQQKKLPALQEAETTQVSW